MVRQQAYLEVDKRIKEWNSIEGVTNKLSHNKFSDWTAAEHARF